MSWQKYLWRKVVISIEADVLPPYQSSATEYVPEPSFVCSLMPYLYIRVVQRNMFQSQALCGGETNDDDHVVLIENITKEVEFMDMFCSLAKLFMIYMSC